MALHKVRKRATEPLRLLEHLLSLTYRFVDQATDIGRSDGIVWDPVVYGLALAESVLCAGYKTGWALAGHTGYNQYFNSYI